MLTIMLNTPVTMTDTAAVPRLRFALLLWLAGIPGVVAITATVLPQLLGQMILSAPVWVISLASLVQSALVSRSCRLDRCCARASGRSPCSRV
jgi:hypothetical protein